uniref:G domain-containing protein n=1 Tax=Electrophorus electricus TaxID=8005 RepID=A0A4W4GLI2_ELEEL
MTVPGHSNERVMTVVFGHPSRAIMPNLGFRIISPNVGYVRILVIGGVGVGKSNFINSVNYYKTHYIEGEDGSPLPFVFNDIMGLEGAKDSGAHVDDIIKALEGVVKEGHKNISDVYKLLLGKVLNGFHINDMLRCYNTYLIDFDTICLTYVSFCAEMPQIIIMTRVDEACPLVKEDLKKIYTSNNIKEKVIIMFIVFLPRDVISLNLEKPSES